MKAEKLFELLGNIDDQHIAAAQKPKHSSRKIAFVAAAVCLCTFVAMFLPAFHRKGRGGAILYMTGKNTVKRISVGGQSDFRTHSNYTTWYE